MGVEDMRVAVEDSRVGQTGPDVTVTVRVPPGDIRVIARRPSAAGEAYVTLAPGGSGAVSVVLSPDKHGLQLTDLVLVEASNDIIQPTAPSFTFKFIQDGIFLPVTFIDDVEIVDRGQQSLAFLQELFTVADGTISATDPAKVQAALAKYAGEHIGVQVKAAEANLYWKRSVNVCVCGRVTRTP